MSVNTAYQSLRPLFMRCYNPIFRYFFMEQLAVVSFLRLGSDLRWRSCVSVPGTQFFDFFGRKVIQPA